MPLIEKIGQMQKQGLSNEEIVHKLQEEGTTPREINEALDQTQVKSAVSGGTEEMQPSLMPAPAKDISGVPAVPMPSPATQTTSQIPQQVPPEVPQQIPPQPTETSAPPAEMPLPYPTPETAAYPAQDTPMVEQTVQPIEEAYGYAPYPGQEQYQEYGQETGTDMVTEITEQIVDEKLDKLKKQISEIIKFKTETESRTASIDERLKRIEMIIDRLQTSIIEKIGDYGRNISDLKSEMITTQESFSKILNPLTENIEKLKGISKPKKKTEAKPPSKKRKTERTTKKGKKRRESFEKYLRR